MHARDNLAEDEQISIWVEAGRLHENNVSIQFSLLLRAACAGVTMELVSLSLKDL
jgi:hypothetical protein